MGIECYIYKKEVDWSLLHQGFSIPITFQIVFQTAIKNMISRGQSKEVLFIIDGVQYPVKLINQKFDEEKFSNHKDVLQIRYNPSSNIAVKFRELFNYTYSFVAHQRKLRNDEHNKKIIKIPPSEAEYIAVYMTDAENVFLVDCIIKNEIEQMSKNLVNQDEFEFEKSVDYKIYDLDSRIEIKEKSVKVRKLDKSIGNSLKLLYDFNCQICGNNFGINFDANIVETHHIDPFVKSLNNNADNQIVICPNHHSVIHYANPVFDRKSRIFIYNNGYREGLILNRHL